jgi:hypothetical protein
VGLHGPDPGGPRWEPPRTCGAHRWRSDERLMASAWRNNERCPLRWAPTPDGFDGYAFRHRENRSIGLDLVGSGGSYPGLHPAAAARLRDGPPRPGRCGLKCPGASKASPGWRSKGTLTPSGTGTTQRNVTGGLTRMPCAWNISAHSGTAYLRDLADHVAARMEQSVGGSRRGEDRGHGLLRPPRRCTRPSRSPRARRRTALGLHRQGQAECSQSGPPPDAGGRP